MLEMLSDSFGYHSREAVRGYTGRKEGQRRTLENVGLAQTLLSEVADGGLSLAFPQALG